MTDYLIVGCGLAGIAIAETAISRGKTVAVFDNDSQTSSKIAGGLYNPVILKRFSGLQDAQQQLDQLQRFYGNLERRLNVTVNHKLAVLRKFTSIEEQNNWFQASDKPALEPFLSTLLINEQFDGILSPFDYGEVLQTGYVDTNKLLEVYKDYLISIGSYRKATFNYDDILVHDDHVEYHSIAAKYVIFAEGFGLQHNPFFNYLPLDGTKGELLIIEAPGLKLDKIVNSNLFILPMGDSRFKVGATYEWNDKSNEPTQQGRHELIDRVTEILSCDFTVIEHQAGVRPTVKDRKPLLGRHPDIENFYIFNGLGTRGVMLGPYMANELLNHIEDGTPIARENNIQRFVSSYQRWDRS